MEPARAIPEAARPSLTFLYHELRAEKSTYSYALDCNEFEEQLALFSRVRAGLTAQAATRSSASLLRPTISFDDGHLSDYEFALPMLERHSMSARFFITVGWTGQKPGYMDWNQVRALRHSGQSIGAHGWTHTLLTHCSRSQLEKELVGARKTLEDRLGCPVTSISLPGGRYNRRVLSACEEAGYSALYSSIPRAEPAAPGLLIGRLNIRSGVALTLIERLLQPQSAELARLNRNYRLKETAKQLLGDTLYARLWSVANRQEPASKTRFHPAS